MEFVLSILKFNEVIEFLKNRASVLKHILKRKRVKVHIVQNPWKCSALVFRNEADIVWNIVNWNRAVKDYRVVMHFVFLLFKTTKAEPRSKFGMEVFQPRVLPCSSANAHVFICSRS